MNRNVRNFLSVYWPFFGLKYDVIASLGHQYRGVECMCLVESVCFSLYDNPKFHLKNTEIQITTGDFRSFHLNSHKNLTRISPRLVSDPKLAYSAGIFWSHYFGLGE